MLAVLICLGFAPATRADKVVAWGPNDFGQCNVPAGLSGVTAVAGGAEHNIALKSDGTIALWGEGYIPFGLYGVTALAATTYQNILVLQDTEALAGVLYKQLLLIQQQVDALKRLLQIQQKDYSFTIPGVTPDEQVTSLVDALMSQKPHITKPIYQSLSGHK